MLNCSVEDIFVSGKDSQGKEILEVYGRKKLEYAVYRIEGRVCLQYADDDKLNADQRKAMAPLNPIRGEINGVLDGWRESRIAHDARQKRAIRYDRRVGDALVVAFEDDVASAGNLLTAIKKDILDERVAWARFEYLIWAFAMGGLASLLIWIIVSNTKLDPDGAFVWHAAAAGTLGAFFSIALGIRGRTVLPDMQRVANTMDAILRILIGVIAAAVLAALVISKAVTVMIGNASPDAKDHAWLYFLIVGFIAGFSERFVPDLLAKATASTEAPEPVVPQTERKAANATATSARSAASAPPDAPDPLPDEALADDCACDIDLTDAEATKDADLPPATGGVALAVIGGGR